ncbi:MAG: ATP-binding cassette subfamily F protein 3 [Alteromonas naphthalenivorans]|jgi:ATP-binding cassette subfamily F protein 3
MIQLKDICLSFGTQKVFDHLSETIGSDQKLGLVGRNGSGKSTLIKAIDRQQQLDKGSIVVSGKARIAYMPQEVVTESNLSVLEEALSSYKDIGGLRQRSQALELLLPDGNADVIEEYAHVSERLSELNVDFAIAETKKMLMGLGFKQAQLESPVDSLSVGWKMRVILAKLLLQKADFYLFDEPTNHLDIVAKDWFLEFLRESDFGFILVCHDKYFLDQLCTTILELDRGQGTMYYGNYTDYEDEKERRLETLKSQYALQQKEITEKKRTIERFKAKASKAKMAKSMQKALDKVERIEVPRDPRKANFKFAETKRAGRLVLEVQDLGFSFGDKKIFEHVTFNIERGEKVGLVAPNGMGKTTLFNVICGKYKQTHGNVRLGLSVDQTIFEQDQNKVLDPNKNVFEEVMDNTGRKTEQDVRRFLGSFQFGKEEIGKKTKVLSGGEKNKVSMVKVLLQDANFLLLDEPTNHLDITSKEVLLCALNQFDGTMLFVSHDHDFVNKLATRIIELTPDGINSYFGNYESYLDQKRLACELSDPSQDKQQSSKNQKSSVSKENRKGDFDKKKETQKLERKIEKIEKDIERINMRFADLEYGTEEFSTAQRQSQEKEKELKAVQKEWEKFIA